MTSIPEADAYELDDPKHPTWLSRQLDKIEMSIDDRLPEK